MNVLYFNDTGQQLVFVVHALNGEWVEDFILLELRACLQ